MKQTALLFALTLACGSNEQGGKSPVSTSTGAPAKTDSNVGKTRAASSKTESPSVRKPADPLGGQSLSTICTSNALALIKWPYDKLQSDFNSLCCIKGGLPEDHEFCNLDWPSSDVLSCSAYDEMRNEIFARYGRAFKSKRWQTLFGQQSWYVVRDDFSDSWLSKTASMNVSQLKKMKKNRVACID